MPSLLSFVLAWTIFSLAVSASCLNSALHGKIGFFSKAPLAFGYTHPSPSECAIECESLSTCQAWLFTVNGKECQLYGSGPVAQAENAGFILGLCGEEHANTPTVSGPSASRAIVSASHSSVPTPNPNKASADHLKRHQHGHVGHHHYHH
ncbi:uncharacterized protein BO72DRAFT_524260 [Aspergillus fijiensis CBS 313.89]|uniref:Apple domain-containing protein n=1 Tax=Aspergillus fijiensis CBS 313.89 TaxID=1448319 RepID=A0A8G1W633_9EURO|nr:uncharacterized protein BO72DRAFT_524260 [Aspergillus fijiensis CBS 313.89]RAK81859.1 hypothetical protein BO72DRAFT_524260 [Aspergillus fijiensis CBS 313.89]